MIESLSIMGTSWKRIRRHLSGYLFLLPSATVLITFVYIPMAYALLVSFTRWDLMSPSKVFVGLQNYLTLLTSREFMMIVRNTLLYTLGVVPTSILIGLVLALGLNENVRFKGFFRVAFFAPVVTSTIAISLAWKWIYHPNFGLMNQFLGFFGISPQRWLVDPRQALVAIIITNIWQNMGYCMVLYLAALQGIPSTYYEAARIDGANQRRMFISITVPLVSPTTFFLLVTMFIRSMQVFASIHTMTEGGPLNATNVVVFYLYQQAFEYFRVGYAFSIAYVLFIIIFIFTLIQKRFTEKFVHYQ